MSITEAGSIVESHHGLVVFKTNDGETHCIEFGHSDKVEESHAHHAATHTIPNPHSQGHTSKHGHHDSADDTHHTRKNLTLHLYSPIGLRATAPPPTAMHAVKVSGLTAESLERDLKKEWHAHEGGKFFHDPQTFVTHVMSKLGL